MYIYEIFRLIKKELDLTNADPTFQHLGKGNYLTSFTYATLPLLLSLSFPLPPSFSPSFPPSHPLFTVGLSTTKQTVLPVAADTTSSALRRAVPRSSEHATFTVRHIYDTRNR